MANKTPCYRVPKEERDSKGRRVWGGLPARPPFTPRKSEPAGMLLRARASGELGKTPLEVLSRLAGGTTFRTPNVGRSTDGGGTGLADVAHALGFVRDPLDQRLALAMASRTDAEWPQVQALAYPQLLQMLLASHNTRALVVGAKRFRVRLVLHDVFHDLVLARPARLPKLSAQRILMTERDYRALYKVIAGFVETRAQAGAHAACRALFGD